MVSRLCRPPFYRITGVPRNLPADSTGLEPAWLLHRTHFPGGLLSIRILSKPKRCDEGVTVTISVVTDRTSKLLHELHGGTFYSPVSFSTISRFALSLWARKRWDSNPQGYDTVAVFKAACFPFASLPNEARTESMIGAGVRYLIESRVRFELT
jgi:hypothetical protein